MKDILELDNKQARKYLMESENFCSIPLPTYFNFKPLLDFVKTKVQNKSCLDDILLKDKGEIKHFPSSYNDVNYTMWINKDGQYAYRPLQLSNPYNYYFLVRTITSKENWRTIQERFHHFKVSTIEVVSIPKVKDYTKPQKRVAYDIEAYIEGFEQRCIALSLQYRYIFVTDIVNCYGSLYTHSIGWALHDKEFAKEHIGDMGLLGNLIDRQIQWMQYNQTNGIPQGSILYDFIAEMVLGYADYMVNERLKEGNITDYKILRYRDDYRILSNDKIELERISLILQEVLAGLNFHLNSSKTLISEDVITASIKKDKLYFIFQDSNYGKDGLGEFSTYQNELLYILEFSKMFPNSGSLQKMLSKFQERFETDEKQKRENWHVLCAIAVEIAMDNPKVYNSIVSILSLFISKISMKAEQESIIKQILDKFSSLPNKGLLQLWMQRITTKISSIPITYDEMLCDIVDGNEYSMLWNFDWIDGCYTQNFPINDIVDREVFQNQQPVIGLDEISPFEY